MKNMLVNIGEVEKLNKLEKMRDDFFEELLAVCEKYKKEIDNPYEKFSTSSEFHDAKLIHDKISEIEKQINETLEKYNGRYMVD